MTHEHEHDEHGEGGGSHAGHSHQMSENADTRYLMIAFCLIVGFMAFEVVAGIVAHSLALLSDAAHMLTDAGALALSLSVIRYMKRPGSEALTYGRRRAEVLSGQANSAVLLVLAALVGYESITRLITPPEVAGLAVTVVAAVGVGVNILAAWVLAKANRTSLNVEGSFQHILTDLYAFIGTFIAGIVILTTGFNRADAIASLVVAFLMAKSGWTMQKAIMRVLLEGAPEGMAPKEVAAALTAQNQVVQVSDLHVWDLAPGYPILTAHVFVEEKTDCHAIRRSLEAMLKEKFKISHTTLQVDHRGEQEREGGTVLAPHCELASPHGTA